MSVKLNTAAKLIAKTSVIGILTLNIVGYISAYMLTHYNTSNPFGWGIARSYNYNSPQDFKLQYSNQKIVINKQEWLDSWLITSPADESRGIVILFHGKDSNKSSLLTSAKIFHTLNYDTLLVDFRGAGNSSGDVTTIGVKEAEDVAIAVDYVKKLQSDNPIILYGLSMGSAAILRAVARHNIQPDGIILELPFVSLLDSVKTRLKSYSLPPSPMAELMVFWGGIQHGFNGFAHKPIEDAEVVQCPVLILAGESDRSIALDKVQRLFENFDSDKSLVIFPQAGHELLARKNPQLWQQSVKNFIQNIDYLKQ